MRNIARILVFAVSPFTAALSAFAAAPPCAPCAGVEVGDPFALLPALAAPPNRAPEAQLYVGIDLALDGSASPASAHALAANGAVPWLRLVFRTPAPLTGHLEALKGELDAAALLARSRPPRAHYQILWRPEGATAGSEGTAMSAKEYAFLIKRASVALGGEDPDANVASAPLPADPAWLDELYGEEVAAYLDELALAPTGSGIGLPAAEIVEKLGQLDPGKPLVLDGLAVPSEPLSLLPAAADAAEHGFAIALFDARSSANGTDLVTPAHIQMLTLLANEFKGELSFDAATRPTGARRAWTFVRGEDLALRVIVEPEPGTDKLTLRFPDPNLKAPMRVAAESGEASPLGGKRESDAVEVRVSKPGAAVVVRLERASVEEREGVAEQVTVGGTRQIPVEEVLRHLQAFEEAQNRRVVHWQAVNDTTLRFQAAAGVQAVEATFEGEAFFRPGQPFDWAWQNFYLNGVRWKGKTIPEIPLIQPEKAAAMPLEVLFTKEYRYSLRGAETIEGRDCWAVDFEPNAPVEGRTLFKGTVWVDRKTWARVRTRAVQLGLAGEVLSNEETIDYAPVDAAGAPAPWGPEAFVLPLHTRAQQVHSVLNIALVVEKEVALTRVSVNGDNFDQRREELFASKATIVRDTDAGLRYMVTPEGAAPGERVVKEGFDHNKLFLLGGVFYDESLDYPLPLAGLNYFDLDFRGKKRQMNFFFGGVLGILNYADPNLFGSKVDLGVDVFGIAIASSDKLFRDGVEQKPEEVEELPARVTLNFGFPLGNFFKVDGSYRLAYSKYTSTDNTAPEFVLPSDHFRHQVDLGLQYARQGYRLNLQAGFNKRSKWEFWGLPGNTEFDPDSDQYTTWEASLSKNWYFTGFRKLGFEVNYLDGSNLDRFSKYQFGFFGGSRVHGYQIGKVRAEKALAVHTTYGLELGSVVRLDAVGDVAWATDKTSGLDQELLAGAGIVGSFMGPWETLVQLDLGTALAGPDSGYVAYVVFLKLFD